jgi:hypothetical protein
MTGIPTNVIMRATGVYRGEGIKNDVGWSLLLLKGYDTLTTSKNAHAKA